MLKAVAPAMMTEVVMVEVVDREVAVVEVVAMVVKRERAMAVGETVVVVAAREVAAAARERVAGLAALKAMAMVMATREVAKEAVAASVADSWEEPDWVMATEARGVVTVVEKQAMVVMLVEEGR